MGTRLILFILLAAFIFMGVVGGPDTPGQGVQGAAIIYQTEPGVAGAWNAMLGALVFLFVLGVAVRLPDILFRPRGKK